MQALSLKHSNVDDLRPSGTWRLVRALALFVAAVALLATFPRNAPAQPAVMPQSALLPSYNPLCDSNLVPCLDTDDLAAHAYAHLLVLPQTELRGASVSIPYGIAIGLFGRLVGGVSTSYTLWWQDNGLYQGHGPLRLSATLLLLPLFPLRPRSFALQYSASVKPTTAAGSRRLPSSPPMS